MSCKWRAAALCALLVPQIFLLQTGILRDLKLQLSFAEQAEPQQDIPDPAPQDIPESLQQDVPDSPQEEEDEDAVPEDLSLLLAGEGKTSFEEEESGEANAPEATPAWPTEAVPEVRTSTTQAFCRCAQLGGEQPPEGLRSFAQEELKNLLKEMRQKLRLFIYPINFHCGRFERRGNRGYWVEKNFYDRAKSSSMRVTDAAKATIYYIPTFTSCWRTYGRTRAAGSQNAAKNIRRMLEDLSLHYPYFKRYRGRRHIWVSVHDMGKTEPLACEEQDIQLPQEMCRDHLPNVLAINSSVLANTADTMEPRKFGVYGFNRAVDVSLVCNADSNLAQTSFKVSATNPRIWSVFFSGKWDKEYLDGLRWRAIRSIQSTHFRKPSMISTGQRPKAYLASLATSELCLAPRGSRVWSPRLFEMLWFGCIPVIVATGYLLPAACFIEWREIAIMVPEEDADKDKSRLDQMRKKIFQVRKHFMWQPKESHGDAFELAMLDVYLKQQRVC
ncbi:unnamed protein product [Effrenium voratum]|uniref:Exostosin GT47 domain-containing protein n=1 Tax=Effrenium voratum TaxID=2562239 RepID=A0AA36MZ79_9DINO|nr:unnamed protein product [Effrenium voratum]